ncbi:hypothetical protein M2102_003342 [Fusobacterium sp. PH5-7]|uniref:hypothetical protein n=1 Tax=Fusobacterium sp. PH5-7 TaxID=2940528 RepID=UPI0024741198|nr:hypothetical protein [Fusobacterium sp. PH5-7]MDH6459680.1 hypothetical protein [Fusobacterium sp. PH5-7]
MEEFELKKGEQIIKKHELKNNKVTLDLIVFESIVGKLEIDFDKKVVNYDFRHGIALE